VDDERRRRKAKEKIDHQGEYWEDIECNTHLLSR